jgi:hypothetical protein
MSNYSHVTKSAIANRAFASGIEKFLADGKTELSQEVKDKLTYEYIDLHRKDNQRAVDSKQKAHLYVASALCQIKLNRIFSEEVKQCIGTASWPCAFCAAKIQMSWNQVALNYAKTITCPCKPDLEQRTVHSWNFN